MLIDGIRRISRFEHDQNESAKKYKARNQLQCKRWHYVKITTLLAFSILNARARFLGQPDV